MTILRIKGVKFHNRAELKFQTKIILPDEVKTKLIPTSGKEDYLEFQMWTSLEDVRGFHSKGSSLRLF